MHVARESGFYDILEQHDEIIPSGKRGQEQFSKAEVKKTKEISTFRIYVEQAIRKPFRLITNELPMHSFFIRINFIRVSRLKLAKF